MGELVSAAWTAIATILVLFTAGTAIGFGMLARRNKRAALGGSPAASPAGKELEAAQRANIALVRADDAVRHADDELGFAVAQFGSSATADFSRALADARARVMEAFALQQKLDDHVPDTSTQRREWTARIVSLCESARTALDTEVRRFDELRQLDLNAPSNLAALRTRLDQLTRRATTADDELALLRRDFAPTALASVSDNVSEAQRAIAAGQQCVEDAQRSIDDTATTSQSAAVAAISAGEDHAHRASHLLEAIDTLAGQLAAASTALEALLGSTRRAVAEAKRVRDRPADAAAGASVMAAVSQTEAALATLDPRDPVAALDRLREANAALDAGLAGERNQRQRLEGAREALAGALVSARSQISATRDYIAARRGRVGGEARTRLAEAERLLAVAEAEADPVLALDTARSAASYARDADALARYDLLG